MKRIKLYLLALVGCLVFTACGSGDKDDIVPGVVDINEYTETYYIPAAGWDVDYTVRKLNFKITTISRAADWLEVSAKTYTSGSPIIKITAQANTSASERKSIVTINSLSGDILTLTLIQAGQNGIADVGNIHNETSDETAYSKER